MDIYSQSTNNVKKYGRTTEATPAKWQKEYTDFNAPLENGVAAPSTKSIEPSPKSDAEPSKGSPEEAPPQVPVKEEKVEDESKKRKRHEGETAEEKAERKRKKKEKKEKRKSKKEESESE